MLYAVCFSNGLYHPFDSGNICCSSQTKGYYHFKRILIDNTNSASSIGTYFHFFSNKLCLVIYVTIISLHIKISIPDIIELLFITVHNQSVFLLLNLECLVLEGNHIFLVPESDPGKYLSRIINLIQVQVRYIYHKHSTSPNRFTTLTIPEFAIILWQMGHGIGFLSS